MDIIKLIQDVGFPIGMCLICAYYVKYTTDKNREDLRDLRNEHATEQKLMSDAINNNTQALLKLTERMELEK